MAFHRIVPLADFPEGHHAPVSVGRKKVALFHINGQLTAIGNTCLHKGGSLGDGFIQKLDDGGTYVACPWHGWQYNILTGKAPGGYEDRQSTHAVKVEDGWIMVDDEPTQKAHKAVHAEDPLADLRALKYETHAGSLNVLGISATNMNDDLPRTSTSEVALEHALQQAREQHGAQTRMIKLRELKFRHCEGYYSRHEQACTWPCSISEMDPNDGMTQVYRDMVLWADVVLLATPIRWGNASSLYYKMAERLNTVQNQITLVDRILIKNKVAAFIVTGGQDNIQAVVGQLNTFFTDLGFAFPPFNFTGWSRGWIAEDMERNVQQFQKSTYIKRSLTELVTNSILLSKQIKQMDCEKMSSPKPGIRDARATEKQSANEHD